MNHSDTAIELGELGDLNKTKEIVIRRPRAKSFHLLLVIDNIEQLNCSKLIGVLFQPNRIKTKSKFAGDGYLLYYCINYDPYCVALYHNNR